jgi:hypothetical protein
MERSWGRRGKIYRRFKPSVLNGTVGPGASRLSERRSHRQFSGVDARWIRLRQAFLRRPAGAGPWRTRRRDRAATRNASSAFVRSRSKSRAFRSDYGGQADSAPRRHLGVFHLSLFTNHLLPIPSGVVVLIVNGALRGSAMSEEVTGEK